MQILPEDNKSWLTLFYSLPEELVSKRPAYMNLPRCPFDVIRSDDYAELLNTDVFLELVWDCYAWSAWQCFEVPNKDGDYREIPGSFNSYSGDFPLWRLSYTIIPYIRDRKSIPNTETNKSYPIQSSQPAVIVIRQWLLSFAHFYGGTT